MISYSFYISNWLFVAFFRTQYAKKILRKGLQIRFSGQGRRLAKSRLKRRLPTDDWFAGFAISAERRQSPCLEHADKYKKGELVA